MTQRIKIIVLSIIKILEEGVVTSFRVVADQIIVKKIVKFLSSFTLNGCTNLIGTNVKIKQIIITATFIYSLVPRIKKYKTTMFHTAGKPLK